MMKEHFLNAIKTIAALAIVFGIVMTTSCSGDDDDDKCTADVTYYADADGDGLGAGGDTQLGCADTAPDGYVTNDLDADDNTASGSQSAYDVIAATAGLDSLQKYLEVYPDLVSLLDGAGTFTVFAPTNAAFLSLLQTPGFPSNISSINPDIIKNVLAYHVATTKYLSTSLTAGTTIATASEGSEEITVTSAGNLGSGSSNPEIEIEFADIETSNGVVHIVKSVLIPPTVGATLTPILGTNAGTLLLGAPFSILAQAIYKADAFAAGVEGMPTLVSILAGEANHTVFAPTNDTFYAAAGVADGDSEEVIDAKVAGFLEAFTGEEFYGIIANHVVIRTTNIAPSELTTGATFTTALNATLTIFNNTGVVPAQNGLGIYIDSNEDVDVTLADGGASLANLDAEVALPNAAINPNGTVHVIAGLLLPPSGN